MADVENSRGPRKTVISAVGRSGTTIIHNLLLEIYTDLYGEDYDQLYEPFLWNSEDLKDYPKNASVESRFGSMDSVSAEGIYHHTTTPLFIEDANSTSISVNLRSYLLANSSRPLVAKFIRANGRLALLDKLYPDARFIILIRNPLDVANSVLTRFSFYGDENHRSDFRRFQNDVERIFGITLPENATRLPPAYKAALWCHFMNVFAVNHAEGKAQYLTIAYEDFRSNKEATAKKICAHINVPYKDEYGQATTLSVGRTTSGPPNLTKSDVDSITPLFNEYRVLASQATNVSTGDIDQVLPRYDAKHLANTPAIARGFGWSPIKAEGQIIKLNSALHEHEKKARIRLADVQRKTFISAQPTQNSWRIPISVIVTSFNNEDTLKSAVNSVLQQTYRPEEVLIADDCSTDNSHQIIESLVASNDLIKPILREQNAGVSANRNDAIAKCQSVFVSQLDGDDQYTPHKLEREARALLGCTDSVAFSDIEFMGHDSTYWECAWLTGLTGNSAMRSMVSRRNPLPRDMLMSKELFQEAEGYREDCSIFEDWAFKIRLASISKSWRYAGTPGTLYRPGGLSQSGAEMLMASALWVLCADVFELLRKTASLHAAFEAILNLQRVEYDHVILSDPDVQDLVSMKMDAFLTDLKAEISSSEDNAVENSINKMQRIIRATHLSISTLMTSR